LSFWQCGDRSESVLGRFEHSCNPGPVLFYRLGAIRTIALPINRKSADFVFQFRQFRACLFDGSRAGRLGLTFSRNAIAVLAKLCMNAIADCHQPQ
jgi:hypothetical protein